MRLKAPIMFTCSTESCLYLITNQPRIIEVKKFIRLHNDFPYLIRDKNTAIRSNQCCSFLNVSLWKLRYTTNTLHGFGKHSCALLGWQRVVEYLTKLLEVFDLGLAFVRSTLTIAIGLHWRISALVTTPSATIWVWIGGLDLCF